MVVGVALQASIFGDLWADDSSAASKVRECVFDEKMSDALGVLVYKDILKQYSDVIDPSIFVNSLLHSYRDPSEGFRASVEYELVSEEVFNKKISNADEVDEPISPIVGTLDERVSQAINYLSTWRDNSKRDEASFDFIRLYATENDMDASDYGVYSREIVNSDGAPDGWLGNFEKECRSIRDKHEDYNLELSNTVDWICTQEMRVDKVTRCQITEDFDGMKLRFSANELEVESYGKDIFGRYQGIYKSWNDILDRLNAVEFDNQLIEFYIPVSTVKKDLGEDSRSAASYKWYLAMRIED